MAEKCKNAYRKKGAKAVFCRAIEGDMDYCGHQYACPRTQRWEANCTVQCTFRSKQPVK